MITFFRKIRLKTLTETKEENEFSLDKSQGLIEQIDVYLSEICN